MDISFLVGHSKIVALQFHSSLYIAFLTWTSSITFFVYYVQWLLTVMCLYLNLSRQTSSPVQFSNRLMNLLSFDVAIVHLITEGEDGSGHKLKTKRVRTSFTEEQLRILHANFRVDSNPDGQDLERIAQQTGLSKRVTQVRYLPMSACLRQTSAFTEFTEAAR